MPARAQWVRSPIPAAAERLEGCGTSPELAILLARRGVEDGEGARRFLNPSLDQLHDPRHLADLEPAVERLVDLQQRKGSVAIVGDYDVDGISSAAMLSAVLSSVGCVTHVLLPDRQKEGYGYQEIHAERAKDLGCELIVTVDCGSSSVRAVQRAQALGLDVVVTDHHIPGEELPAGALHVNPKQSRCTYPFDQLAAAGITFKLCLTLLESLGKTPNFEALLRIACLGTIADLVPLLGENRVIAGLGLKALEGARSPGLRALIQSCGMRKPYCAEDIGFRIGPRLNAAGRLSDPYSALHLLMSRDPRQAEVIAGELELLNRQRQTEEARVTAEARKKVGERGRLPGILVEWSESWPKGVVGLAAGRLAAEFQRPVVLLSAGESLVTGSGRGTRRIDIHRFLLPWSGDLVRFGGHSQAIGLTAELARIEELRRAWESAAESWPADWLEPAIEYELDVPAARIADGSLREMASLAPFGQGNPRPLARIGPLRLAGEPRTFGRGHLSALATGEGGEIVNLIGWGWAERRPSLSGRFEVLGSIETDAFSGRDVVRLTDARSLQGA